MAHTMQSAPMGHLNGAMRHRDTLPPLNHLDLDKLKSERGEKNSFTTMNGFSVLNPPLESPSTLYPGPPPPYSSTVGLINGQSDYTSPAETVARRALRDEDSSLEIRKSLPSIHEALGDKTMPFPPSLPATIQPPPMTVSSTAASQGFPEAPKGPLNPFSQPSAPSRDITFGSQILPHSSAATTHSHKGSLSESEPRSSISQTFGYPGSPQSVVQPSFRPPLSMSSLNASVSEQPMIRSPSTNDRRRQAYPFSQFNNPMPPPTVEPNPPSAPYQFTAGPKLEDRHPYPRPPDSPYVDTVKRHLDVYDAELGLNEIGDISSRTLDFSRLWGQRYHQGNRNGYHQESLPSPQEIDEMIRQSHRVIDNLTRIREAAVAQQNALSEQRARMARGPHAEEDFGGFSDEFKSGGFAGGDAKKRRGKAAPPGRCHSCNRAETPEWRRGPDGARTLCNACGLHYAKLTRKLGVNKAAALSGSNLRPKNLDQRI